MIFLFTDYEELKCELCDKLFVGRHPNEGGDILCPDCIKGDELPLFGGDGEAIVPPESVMEEIEHCAGGGHFE